MKIYATALPFLELDDPDSLKVGDSVLAIGTPFGLSLTVTAGILSARYRTIDDDLTISSIYKG